MSAYLTTASTVPTATKPSILATNASQDIISTTQDALVTVPTDITPTPPLVNVNIVCPTVSCV